MQTAYGNVTISEFDEATKCLAKLKEIDLKSLIKLLKEKLIQKKMDKLFTSISQIQAYSSKLSNWKIQS
jgi:hypothetical protein